MGRPTTGGTWTQAYSTQTTNWGNYSVTVSGSPIVGTAEVECVCSNSVSCVNYANFASHKHWVNTGLVASGTCTEYTKKPVANFTALPVSGTALPVSGTAPLNVTFTDTSTGSPTTWNWSFGDGTNSTEQNPSHIYEAAGTYDVSLTAANAGGSNATVKAGYINVTGEGPVADFTGTPTSGESELSVQFTDTSTGNPTSWNWSFGDGEYSEEQSPSHAFIIADSYDVSLTVENENGTSTETKQNYISVTCPSYVSCNVTLSDPPYIDFGINRMRCPEDHEGAWWNASCSANTIIRWSRAGNSSSFNSKLSPWMWKRYPCCPDPGYSWAFDTPANKPIYYTAVKNSGIPLPDGGTFAHAVAAEYLASGDVKNSTWSDWKFFNYHVKNIPTGDPQQMPSGNGTVNTTVDIKEISGFGKCGQPNADIVMKFTIDQNNIVTPHPVVSYTNGYIVSKTGKTVMADDTIPIDLKNLLYSISDNKQFTINKWEFNPASKELTLYAHDINNQKEIENLQKNRVNKYSIRVVHDIEFERNREDVRKQLSDLQKNPDYQISGMVMTTDTLNDPPEKYVELWVYKTTPENRKLDNTVINGWRISVYTESLSPSSSWGSY